MKPWPKRILLAASGGFVLLILAVVAFFVFWDPCANSAFEEFGSPGSGWKVVVFERDCGATTDFSTQASILPADSPLPKHGGNVLSIESDHGKTPVGSDGKIAVKVRFDGNSAVTLAYPANARAFKQVAAKDGLVVRHERLRTDDRGERSSP